jgi:5-methylthioadenosine/S-adenosylhomocysteine deaminase
MSILIKNVLFNDRTIDIYIEGKEIKQIGEGLSFPADTGW